VLIRLLLFVAIGYILIRLIQVTMRILSSRGGRDGDENISSGSTSRKPEPEQFKDVRDADFEDITPKEGNGKSESSPGTKQPPGSL
jgi:hypothetical protein